MLHSFPQDLPLLVAAAGFLFMGAAALARPSLITRQFDIRDLSATGRSEVRAVYGGFGVAMAAVLVVALMDAERRSGIGLAAGCALIGMGLGRVASATIDRTISRAPLFYLVVELVFGALLIGAR